MIPFVVTLSTLMLTLGGCVWLTKSVSITGFPKSYTAFSLAKPLGVPLGILILIAATVLMTVLMQSSMQGSWVQAVGLNERAARVAGVPIRCVVGGAYLFAGLMSGLTGIVLTARLGAASATMGGDALTLDTIASCVVGGVSIYGGVGKIYGAVLGAILITVLSNAMNLAGVSFYISLVIKGIVIIVLVAVERCRRRVA